MPELHTRSSTLALVPTISRYLWVTCEDSDWDLLEPRLRTEAETILSTLATEAD